MTVSSALDLWGFQEGRIWGLPGSGPPGELHLSWNITPLATVMEHPPARTISISFVRGEHARRDLS